MKYFSGTNIKSMVGHELLLNQTSGHGVKKSKNRWSKTSSTNYYEVNSSIKTCFLRSDDVVAWTQHAAALTYICNRVARVLSRRYGHGNLVS